MSGIKNEVNPYKEVLIALVSLLKEQGIESAGQIEGLNAYQALGEVFSQAAIWDIPLDELDLNAFDLDSLINPVRQRPTPPPQTARP